MKTKKRFLVTMLCAAAILSGSCVFALSSCDDRETEETVKVDVLSDMEYRTTTGRYVSRNTDGALSVEENENYECTLLEVRPGERYVVSLAVQATGSYGVLLADADETVVDRMLWSKNTYVEYNDVQITVPDDVFFVAVNTRKPKALCVKKLVKEERKIESEKRLPDTLTVAAVNCGRYDYGEEDVTAEDYLSEWKRMLSSNPYDLFMFEDVAEDFSETVRSDSFMSEKGNYFTKINGGYDDGEKNLRASTKVEPETATMVALDYSIDGSTKTSKRFLALKLTFHIGKKHIAVYGLHLVAEAHISETVQPDGSSLSQKLRQKQFSQLIYDARFYDESVFLGDFNAQDTVEYTTFENAGYTLANGGAFGSFATLRDIPADNIIVSKGFSIREVTLLDEYALNTDHTPIKAKIQLK